MKRVIAAAVSAVVLVSVGAAPAAALTTNQKLNQLTKRVTALEKANKKLKKQIADTNDVAVASLFVGVCGLGVTADALESTWGTINQVAGRTVIASQSPVQEPACSRLQVPRNVVVPPNIDAFAQLLRLVNPFDALFRTALS